MYNPVQELFSKSVSKEDVIDLFFMGCSGINAIADIMRCADISGTNKDIIEDLGSALLILNGVIEISAVKIKESTHE